MKYQDYLISTDQQVLFDTVVEKLAAQGRKSYLKGVGCQYLNPEGLRCAAGWCMTDAGIQVAHRDEEHGGSCRVDSLSFAIPDPVKDLLGALQSAHDGAHSRASLVRRLTEVAERRMLSTAKLQERMNDEWELAGPWEAHDE